MGHITDDWQNIHLDSTFRKMLLRRFDDLSEIHKMTKGFKYEFIDYFNELNKKGEKDNYMVTIFSSLNPEDYVVVDLAKVKNWYSNRNAIVLISDDEHSIFNMDNVVNVTFTKKDERII